MSIEKQQRQNKIVLRIRELQGEKDQQGGYIGFEKSAELFTLQTEANTNDWMYW